jgi:hypothetical protein
MRRKVKRMDEREDFEMCMKVEWEGRLRQMS